ncbi:hypothetical protein Y032_0457g1809 [Ancylostoma ceylanicum]|uniref:Uncharacterized protein n=1 Tax=Ancylostoma ceylanicum TaxID=53326 RepID=A0A016WYD1_9BILA|nr:hypothetical protein Y032_0457g1809 [Ancylostoma ceylanicum]
MVDALSIHSVMEQCYVLAIFLSVVALSESIQQQPDCSQLRQYAMPRNVRLDLATKVLAYENKRDASVSAVYLCALEGLAGLILENPHKPLTCPHSLGMHSLVFEIEEEPDINVGVMSQAAINVWKDHIPHKALHMGREYEINSRYCR